MKIIRVMVLPLLLAVHGLAAGGIERGGAAYTQGDYGTALREWRPLAEQGDAGAQLNLGFMYDNGYGVPQDYKEAVKWYRRAAEQGNDRAQYRLGLMYINGQGIQQDYKEAMKWFRKAAEQGFASAQFDLGVMYHNGEGVPKNYVQAFKWFAIAGANGNEDGTSSRGRIAIEMTPAQVAEAKKLVREWMEKHP